MLAPPTVLTPSAWQPGAFPLGMPVHSLTSDP